jgi:hypothetical protein
VKKEKKEGNFVVLANIYNRKGEAYAMVSGRLDR